MIAIIDSGIGNIRSVANALDYIKTEYLITSSAIDITKCQKIIFPGVGSFSNGMKSISKSGLSKMFKKEVLINQKPFLGICLGMQLLAEIGEEDGICSGLGWIKGKVKLLDNTLPHFKLPHIGWNNVITVKKSLLYNKIHPNSSFYFVHSYTIEPTNSDLVIATCTYGKTFTASIQQNNIYGVQFHPEKSHKNGLQLLHNFVTLA